MEMFSLIVLNVRNHYIMTMLTRILLSQPSLTSNSRYYNGER